MLGTTGSGTVVPRHDAALIGQDHRNVLLGAKIRPPQPRAGLVPRDALVERMLARQQEPVVAVVAPPGYGKTTLLAEWSARHPHDVAWISIDESDNDPSLLLSAAALAFGRAGRLGSDIVDVVQARTKSVPVAIDLLTAGVAAADSMVVVLDNAESVTNPESLDVMTALALRLPWGSQFAYSSRAPLPLPAALSRSHGAVVEIGIDDLAMDLAEAQALLANVGVSLTPGELGELHGKTEGWPVGLYLAGLASKGRRQAVTTAFAFRGDDVLMSDYLRTEVLAPLPEATMSFLVRTSVLEHLSGPLCDAVLGTHGAQATLEQLEASNLLLVPLDRRRSWYRYHRLFRDLLVTELHRREPGLVPELHRRAAEWLEHNGLVDAAVEHAQQCGDADRVVRLVVSAVQPSYAAGNVDRALGWFEWFRTEGLVDRYPDVAVMGAMAEALSGRPASAERWTAAAESERRGDERGGPGRGADDGSSFAGRLAYLRSVLCRDGPEQIRVDARLAQERLGPGDALFPASLLFEGLALVLDGEPHLAEPILAHSYDVATYAGATPTAVAALAQLALLAAGRHEWDEAGELADRAVDVVESQHLHDYISAAYAYAAAARVAAHRGDRRAAFDHLARCARVRHLLTYGVPASALVQLEIARAYLELADPTGARTVLREASDLLRQRPNLGTVSRQADELQQQLDAIRQGSIGASSLTAAELRLLPYLATHLTFREIGDRLHVSRHTVKSQAISVYRKLGASSRSESIDRAREIGLLTP